MQERGKNHYEREGLRQYNKFKLQLEATIQYLNFK